MKQARLGTAMNRRRAAACEHAGKLRDSVHHALGRPRAPGPAVPKGGARLAMAVELAPQTGPDLA
eukprot:7175405-Prymnesium_polylepis.1